MATNNYEEFNKFQIAFFTNIDDFSKFTNFEIKKHGYVLINNLAKGFPNLADIISNINGINWSGITSPSILRALQRKFVNKNIRVRIPQFIYYKNLKPEKETKTRIKKEKNLYEFESSIVFQICSILRYDSKTYEYLKYSETVQNLGKQLLGENIQQEKIKTKKSKKS